MRTALLAAVVAAASPLLPGACEERGGTPAGDARPSAAEVAWIDDYGEWAIELDRAWNKAGRAIGESFAGRGDPEEYAEAAEGLAECSQSLRERVGRPPTARLVALNAMLEDACRAFERAVRNRIRVFRGEIDRLLAAQRYEGEAEFALTKFRVRLDEQLGDARALPVRRGPGGSRIDPRYGAAADVVAHGDVEVRCWSEGDWRLVRSVQAALADEAFIDVWGFVTPALRRVSLHPRTCAGLDLLTYRGARPRGGPAARAIARGVLTLAHEAEHIVTGRSEAVSECYALQKLRIVAVALGADRAYAERLTRIAWRRLYPENEDEYRTKRCRDGGPLDLNRESSRFP